MGYTITKDIHLNTIWTKRISQQFLFWHSHITSPYYQTPGYTRTRRHSPAVSPRAPRVSFRWFGPQLLEQVTEPPGLLEMVASAAQCCLCPSGLTPEELPKEAENFLKDHGKTNHRALVWGQLLFFQAKNFSTKHMANAVSLRINMLSCRLWEWDISNLSSQSVTELLSVAAHCETSVSPC